MAADVDPCAGIVVLPPGAARALVLLDDREGQPGLRQADAGEDPAHAAADHDDRRRGLLDVRDLVAPGDLPAVAALELHVVEEQAGQLALDGTPAEEPHHLLQQLPGQLHRDAPAVAVGGDGRHGTAADLGHVLRPTSRPWMSERHAHVGWISPRTHDGSPRHVHERAQQRRDADVLERGGDRLVVVLERLAGKTVSRHGRHPGRRAPTRQSDEVLSSPAYSVVRA